MSAKTKPKPFRADHVGSYLRPAKLQTARTQNQAGTLSAEALREIEDEHITALVRKQEAVGLQAVTDGELRREFFHTDFLQQLDGVEITWGEFASKFRKDDGTEVGLRPPTMHVVGKIKHAKSIQGRDFDFLAKTTERIAKVTIPAPSMLHFRGGRDAISREVYPDLEGFYRDLAEAYAEEAADLAVRGCRYLQMDDTNLAYLCDPAIRANTKARGDDPDALTHLYCRLFNDAVARRHGDMLLSVHLCRGNFKSAWVAEGSYEPVADILLNEMKVDSFFLEYDDERSGGFAPLRFLPKGKTVVLGLMSSKHAAVEAKDDIKRRIEEAAVYAPLDQLALSHQCGFSSTSHGNDLSEADQWRKLERMVELAQEVWG
jgi:5-methyltetrahydropteroyltriglutamate--homocysteine methyltransferase